MKRALVALLVFAAAACQVLPLSPGQTWVVVCDGAGFEYVGDPLSVLVTCGGVEENVYTCDEATPSAVLEGDTVTVSCGTPDLSVTRGVFAVACGGPNHVSNDDPIVYPGVPGAAHQHEFYGNTTTDAHSTQASLLGAPSVCDDRGDTAAYWHPTLFANGVRLPVVQTVFYYGNRTLTPNAQVRAHPAGLRVIAGTAAATGPQGTNVMWWGCEDAGPLSRELTPPQCPTTTSGLSVHVVVPECWNGRDLDSADHRSHMAYFTNGACPSTHPVLLPSVVLRFKWRGHHPDPATLTLSSGATHTMHVDFWNAWDQPRLEALTNFCIRGGRTCSDADRDAVTP